jgi:hypothetical protein
VLPDNISFNTSRVESNLFEVNEESWSDYKAIDSVKTVFDDLQSKAIRRSILEWFVTFALFLLLAEMAIIKLLK